MPSLRFDTLIGWKYGDQVFTTSHLTNDELKWKLHYKCFDDFTVPGIAELVVPQFCCKAADSGNRPGCKRTGYDFRYLPAVYEVGI